MTLLADGGDKDSSNKVVLLLTETVAELAEKSSRIAYSMGSGERRDVILETSSHRTLRTIWRIGCPGVI
jgi:hypothetical protein